MVAGFHLSLSGRFWVSPEACRSGSVSAPRNARCELGQARAVAAELSALLPLKPDWFVEAVLAEALHAAGDDESALQHALAP
jgi:hypothetical protein